MIPIFQCQLRESKIPQKTGPRSPNPDRPAGQYPGPYRMAGFSVAQQRQLRAKEWEVVGEEHMRVTDSIILYDYPNI